MFDDQGLGLDLGMDFRGYEPERARAAAGPAGSGPGNELYGLTPNKEPEYDTAPGTEILHWHVRCSATVLILSWPLCRTLLFQPFPPKVSLW